MTKKASADSKSKAPKTAVNKPAAKAAEAKVPEANGPEANAPETKAPETKAPETKVPEAKAPETKAPETKAPEKAKGQAKFDIKRAKEVFASHNVDKIYFTSDGTAFIEPQYARLHAPSLKDEKVITVKRQEV